IKPGLFFPKSSIGDDSMSDWTIGYEIIDNQKSPGKPLVRSARFKKSKWVRDDVATRSVLYFGIQRTVPASERREFKKFASYSYKFDGNLESLSTTIQREVTRILGKDMSHFLRSKIAKGGFIFVGGDGNIRYSEFHFGAGESSVIRMVSEIESAPENALVLIEEIENGLHPVAVKRMVEYLIDVAKRRSIQSIFTTHSESSLDPLPPEAIWSSISGKTSQGKISIEALRALDDRTDERMAIFVEDSFAKQWVESIIRYALPEHVDEIGVYSVSGDSPALQTHKSHMADPSISTRSMCILDGNSQKAAAPDEGIIKLPGEIPEAVVFNYVREALAELSLKLTVAMHLFSDKEPKVTSVVRDVSNSNRDPHLLFDQVGQKAGLVPTAIVSSAFISLWMEGNPREVAMIANEIGRNLQPLPRTGG
ncbi:MAG TPA: AAA family ATPase, partial [Chthoniobacteraceae bacterium]|nr:AAA family ATPase [Chthoniobacteraceae bacterium]